MYKQCQTEYSEERQHRLEQGLLRVMGKKKFEQITVTDLCEELGIPRKSFYRYFDSKEGALYALIDHTLMAFNLHTTRPEFHDEQTPMQYMAGIFSAWVEQKELLDALEKSGLSGLLIQRALEVTKELDTIPDFMQINDRRLREYGTMFTVCGLMSIIVQWHRDGFAKSVEDMAGLTMEMFAKPLFSINLNGK
ncbi:MAG: TetR/AcrR family transcriptional regulator [Oscillospiraceae bacterium]|nr:TetR/AcrR family transcriptional regulator [Oscillospiraceae bacterium]